MTSYLWAAVVVVGLVAIVALGLSLAAVRQVGALRRRLTEFEPFDDLPQPGDAVPEFEAATVDGGTVGTGDLAGPDVLVLFVDGSCATCFDAVELLRERYAGAVASPDTVRPIAIVIGQPEEREPMVAKLAPLARVVEETLHTGLPARFGVRGFPAALVAGGGVVRMATHRIDQIDVGTPA